MDVDIFSVIKNELEELENSLSRAIVTDVPLVAEIIEHLISSGGKRLRPALFILSARSGNNFEIDKALPLAVALELIHTASLVHDDVIDEADTRRGVMTANAGWGNKIAVLSGDFLFATAFRLITEQNYRKDVNCALVNLVCTLSEGEISQDYGLYEVPTIDEYCERIRKKTADFLGICCRLGAIVGGMDKDDANFMADYGLAVGMAFQITDDLLDLRQTSENIGKPAGHDLLHGVVTLPVIRAIEVLVDSPEGEELKAIATNPQLTERDAERAVMLVGLTDGVQYAQRIADDHLRRAKECLPRGIEPVMRDTYIAVADFIGRREF